MFSSTIHASLAHEREIELRQAGRRVGLGRPGRVRPASADANDVTIRVAGEADRRVLEQLAQLDSRPAPAGYVLVAEVDGELRAAISVAGGEPIADPFHATASLTSLLALRAAQLRAGEPVPSDAPARRRLVAVLTR